MGAWIENKNGVNLIIKDACEISSRRGKQRRSLRGSIRSS